MLFGSKSHSLPFLPSFLFSLMADHEDGKSQLEEEGVEGDGEEEGVEGDGEEEGVEGDGEEEGPESEEKSFFNESKCNLSVMSAQNCHVLAQNRTEYKKTDSLSVTA